MILSHHYRFIFIKPRKTAGTSVEIGLSDLLEPGDYATSLNEQEEGLRASKPGVRIGSDWFWPRCRFYRPIFLRTHASLEKTYGVFGEEVYGYRVISMTRNPWDRAVSRFFWDMRDTDIRNRDLATQKAAFIRFTHRYGPRTWLNHFSLRKRQRTLDSGRVLYFVDGRCRADYIIRFEFLEQDLNGLQDYLGLSKKPSVEGVQAKAGLRPRTMQRRWTDLYDAATRQLVAECCRWEIEHFGYDFEGQKTPSGPFLSIEPHRSRAA